MRGGVNRNRTLGEEDGERWMKGSCGEGERGAPKNRRTTIISNREFQLCPRGCRSFYSVDLCQSESLPCPVLGLSPKRPGVHWDRTQTDRPIQIRLTAFQPTTEQE